MYTSTTLIEDLRSLVPQIEGLARTHVRRLSERDARGEGAESQGAIVLADAEVVVARVSAEEEARVRALLEKEADTTRTRLQSIEGRLNDATFVARAPADVTARQRELAASLRERLARIEAELKDLN